MKEKAYSDVQVDDSLIERVRALCPDETESKDFVSVFAEKAMVNALNMFEMLPGSAAGIIPGSRIRLPALPTREEIAAYCNALWPDRPRPITERTVRGWDERGFLKPHPTMGWPVRYVGADVVEFLNGKFKSPF